MIEPGLHGVTQGRQPGVPQPILEHWGCRTEPPFHSARASPSPVTQDAEGWVGIIVGQQGMTCLLSSWSLVQFKPSGRYCGEDLAGHWRRWPEVLFRVETLGDISRLIQFLLTRRGRALFRSGGNRHLCQPWRLFP